MVFGERLASGSVQRRPLAQRARSKGVDIAACVFDPAASEIRLFLNDASGAPFGDFAPLAAALAEKDERLVFAMNAGMYHDDRTPVGLYVENGAALKAANTKDGPGNFHMKPNGVFWLSRPDDVEPGEAASLAAHVATTEDYLRGAHFVVGATAVRADASHRRRAPPAVHRGLDQPQAAQRRRGAGRRRGRLLAVADAPVNFETFARFFRDEMKTPNALYLDGSISRLYAPSIDRVDPGLKMGPIVGVVAPAGPPPLNE